MKNNYSLYLIFLLGITSYFIIYYSSLYSLFNDQIVLILIHTYLLLSLLIFKKLEFGKDEKFSNFGYAFISISIFFRLFFLFDTLIFGSRFDEFPETVEHNNIQHLVLKAESIFLIGLILLIKSWKIFYKSSIFNVSFTHSSFSNYAWIYIYCLFTQLVLKLTDFDLGPFVQFTFVLNSFGVASIFFIFNSETSSIKMKSIILSFFWGLPLALLSFKSGMKEAMFFPFVPFVILTWKFFKSKFFRVLIVFSIFITLSFSQIYITYIRYESWLNERSLSFAEILNNSILSADFDVFYAALSTVFSRLNSTIPHATTIAMVDNNGFLTKEIIGAIPSTLVPRLIWTDKPVLRPGSDHTKRIRGQEYDNDVVLSASAPGFFTELYLGGGIFIVIFFSLFYGFLVSKIQLFTFRFYPVIFNSLNFYLIYNIFRFDEIAVVYAYTGLLILFVSLNILAVLLKFKNLLFHA
jgi:hypothetical protein